MPINPTRHKVLPVKNLKRQIPQQIPLDAIAIDPLLQNPQRRLQHTPPQPLPPGSVPDEELAALVQGGGVADQGLEGGVDAVAVGEDVVGYSGGAAPEEVRERGDGVREFVGDFEDEVD